MPPKNRSSDAPFRVGIIANSVDLLTLDRAGGFVHLIETARCWVGTELIVMAPANTEAIFRSRLKISHFVAIPSFGNGTTAVSMLLRAVASLGSVSRLRRECDVAMAMSHSVPDVLPAVFFGRKRAAVQLWHFIGNPFARPGNVLRNIMAFGNETLGLSLARQCRGYILGSSFLAKEMRVEGRPYTYVTSNGVAAEVANIPAIRNGAIFVGRLHAAKGVDDLVAAWALVHRALPDERLTIVGRGDSAFRAKLENQIDKLDLRNVVSIRDDVSNEKKVRLLAEARLFVFPSKEEGWGIALAEAMAFGLPCVTYELAPFEGIFPRGRRSVPIGDVAALATTTIELFKDRSLYEQLSREAFDLAKTFTWKSAADVELRALREIAE